MVYEYANERIFHMFEIKELLSCLFKIETIIPIFYLPMIPLLHSGSCGMELREKTYSIMNLIKHLMAGAYVIEAKKRALFTRQGK